VCTQASVRSHRLPPGQKTLIDVAFSTTIDGPGRHGEVIDIAGNDPRLTHRRPLQHDLAFITVTPATSGG
jgi:hypothetical protein